MYKRTPLANVSQRLKEAIRRKRNKLGHFPVLTISFFDNFWFKNSLLSLHCKLSMYERVCAAKMALVSAFYVLTGT